MKQSLPIESGRQPAARSHRTPGNVLPVSQTFIDNRAPTTAQRQLMARMTSSPQAVAQHMLSEKIHNSPRMLAQRKQTTFVSGKVAQRVEDEEDLLQGKFMAIQRIEEEKSLQGKFTVTQKVEEEEPLQEKFEAVQCMEKDEELLQGKFDAAQLEQEPAAKLNNTGLPDNLKQGIENLSGMSMDNVKVHYNSSRPAQLNALAYAQGTDIHVGSGQERHLPHEAWHIVQQAQGRVKPTMQMACGVAVNDDQGLEQEADVMGAKAIQRVAKSAGAASLQNTKTPQAVVQMVRGRCYSAANCGGRVLSRPHHKHNCCGGRRSSGTSYRDGSTGICSRC